MDIRIHDRWRNVTVVPTKVLASKPYTMRVLMSSVHTAIKDGQAQFECDQEWIDALNAEQASSDIKEFGGVPIKVTE